MVGAVDLKKLRKALSLGEDEDWEFKDGRRGLGKSWAESVSAFANTDGGTIVCGIESQDRDRIHVARGISDPRDYREKIWVALRSKEVISFHCCVKGDVGTIPFDGVDLVYVRVPPASRQHRPVHLGKRPYNGNTFRRYESMDCACSDEEVDDMLRDARGLPQDGEIIRGTSLDDADKDTLKAYRNRLASFSPESKLLAKDDQAFLRAIGAWKEDEKPKLQGLTLAGLLMFGTSVSIAEALPNITLNYSDQSKGGARYDHRISSDDDGWGAANLFNFYFAAYPHLVQDLDKPFGLSSDAMRKGKTPFHDALREALINALVHTDYAGRGTIRAVKLPDAFVFENPGRSLTPLSRIKAARGEHKRLSDIRNPNIARMFARLGLAEKDGFGLPTIYSAWEQGKRHDPKLEEDSERKLVVVTLPLLSQISPDIEAKLRRAIGPDFALLSMLDKDILLYAAQFGEVTTKAISAISRAHPAEASGRMRFLANKGWLKRRGSDAKPYYTLQTKRGEASPWGEDLFGEGTWGSGTASPLPQGEGGKSLEALLNRIRDGAAYRPEIEKAILLLCAGQFRSTPMLAATLGRRSVGRFQTNYIAPLVASGRLEPKFKDRATMPGQAYKTTGT